MRKDGRELYNNGTIQKYFYPGQEPAGFIRGRLPMTEEHKANIKKSLNRPETRAKIQENNDRIWGNPETRAAMIAKQQETLLKNHADESGSLDDYYKKRQEETLQNHIDKYGSIEEFNAITLQKRRDTCIERFGVDSNFKNPESLEKRKATWIEKYGCEHPNQSAEVQARRKATCIERYGVDSVAKTDWFQTKVRESIIEKYGSIESYFQQLIEKQKQTCKERYGVDSYFQTEEFKQRAEATLVKNYGSLAAARDAIHSKYVATIRARYDVDNYFQSGEFFDSMTDEKKQARYQSAVQTKYKNNSFNHSVGEAIMYDKLIEMFGKENVITSYQDPRYARDDGYMFRCDFYIVSHDLFIELNLHPTHGTHPFDEDNIEDVVLLDQLQTSCVAWDKNVAAVWGGLDVEKMRVAKKNKLNYKVVYNLNDFKSEL